MPVLVFFFVKYSEQTRLSGVVSPVFSCDRHIFLCRTKNRQVPKHRVFLSFSPFEKWGGFSHSRIQFIDNAFFLLITNLNSELTRFKNETYIYWNVRRLVALESIFIRAPRLRKICLNIAWDLMHAFLISIDFSSISKILWS